jgi:uncharacterized protein (DUF302 family)
MAGRAATSADRLSRPSRCYRIREHECSQSFVTRSRSSPRLTSRVRESLKARGFGILTEVDVTETLRQKLGIETKPYKILGACNPAIAHAAMQAEAKVGAFLPCGVALYEGDSPAETLACLQNPAIIADVFDDPALRSPADEALSKLDEALREVGTAA